MSECRVITIAMSTGALAEETARIVAERLGYRSLNEEVIAWAAERAGVTAEEVEAVEHSQPLVARILNAMAMISAPELGTWTPDVVAGDPTPHYRAMIQDVIRQAATAGNAVIVAHGAGILLRERPEVLRVFLTGSCEVRAGRVAAERGIDPRAARRVVAHADRERRAYLQRFFGLEQEAPAHYDLVVNTDRLSPAEAAHTIVAASCPIATVSVARPDDGLTRD